MSPTNHSDNSWQEVRRGKNKDREPSRTASGGRNLPNIQNVSRVAASGRSLSKAQPVLQTAPSGRAQPNAILHQTTTPKRKEAIPYEIKNAREWDPNRRPQDHSSESSDEDEDYDLDYDEWPEVSGHITSNATSSGAQLVSNQRPIVNAHPRGQPPFHPKVHAPHGRPTPGPRPAHPRARFNFKKDNLAKTAFRRRLEPSGRFMLPRDCPDIEPNQKRMYDTFEEIGVRLGSFIRPPQHVKDRELLLWGDARQVQNTKGELNRWLDKCLQRGLPRKPMGKDNFSKETSVVGDQHHRLIRKMHKEAKILEFQQAPADGQVFLYAGAFIWPVDEVRPEDILGPSLEAFDPVRYQYHCHIIFDHRLSIFRIFSDREDAINKTIDRIVGTMREYVAKSVRPDMLILIEPPIPSVVRKDVSVRRLSADDSKAGQSMIPVLTGSTLDAECRREWIEKSDELMRKNNHRMELSLRKCVATLPHHRGLVRIRVQFGTFALKVFRWKDGAESTPFEEFIDNTSMAGTKGRMVREQVNIWIDFCTLLMSTSSLQIKKDATTIIAKVQKATHLFLPMDSSNTSLEAVVPSFSACFEFKNLDTPPMNFLLEMRSSPAAPTVYEEVQALWTRTDRRDNAVPLEIFMARLDSGASWKLQASTENSIDPSRINPKMKEFAEGVRLVKIPSTKTELTGQKVFTWNKDLPGGMQPSAFEQKTALRYRLTHHPEWEFELARYDNYGNPTSETLPVETNWGATLHNTSWDSILTANSTLGIGETGGWEAKLETFFPPGSDTADMEGVEGRDPGVTEFLRTVETVSRFIDNIKKELPHLRG